MPQNFDEWLSQQGRPENPACPRNPSPAVREAILDRKADEYNNILPDGLHYGADGTLHAYCRSCGTEFQWEWPVEEFDLNTSYCGGSPRCMP